MQQWKLVLFSFLVFFVLSPFRVLASGTIDSTYYYAWSERAGWINFLPSAGNITVSNSTITGYAWVPNYGWIILDPSTSGVTNNGEGVLSGYAWGEQLGFINFSGVTIDQDGYFHGFASSTATGRISFNCVDTNSCSSSDFKVRTNWRSTTTNLPQALSDTPLTFTTTSIDLPSSGQIFATTTLINSAEAKIIIPRGAIIRKADGSLFDGSIEIPISKNRAELPKELHSSNTFISAAEINTGETSVTFDKNITVTLPIPSGSSRTNLRINYFDSGSNQYRLAGNGGTIANDGQTISVQVNHLTTFVALSDASSDNGTNFASGETKNIPHTAAVFMPQPTIKNTSLPQLNAQNSNKNDVDILSPSPVCSLYISDKEKAMLNNSTVLKKIQAFLIDNEKMNNLEKSGKYDAATRKAINQFQQKYATDILLQSNLTAPTGIIGKATIQKINQLVCEFAKSPSEKSGSKLTPVTTLRFTKDLKPGTVDQQVLYLQQFLNDTGYMVATSGPGSPGQETTRFGAGTAKALIEFQKKNKISPAKGFFGQITRSVLLKIIQQK